MYLFNDEKVLKYSQMKTCILEIIVLILKDVTTKLLMIILFTSFFSGNVCLPFSKPPEIDECSSTPCQNGASCIDQVNSFSCNCTDGHEGTRCEIGKLDYFLTRLIYFVHTVQHSTLYKIGVHVIYEYEPFYCFIVHSLRNSVLRKPYAVADPLRGRRPLNSDKLWEFLSIFYQNA